MEILPQLGRDVAPLAVQFECVCNALESRPVQGFDLAGKPGQIKKRLSRFLYTTQLVRSPHVLSCAGEVGRDGGMGGGDGVGKGGRGGVARDPVLEVVG